MSEIAIRVESFSKLYRIGRPERVGKLLDNLFTETRKEKKTWRL